MMSNKSLVGAMCEVAAAVCRPVKVADNYTRGQIEERNRYRDFNKQQPVENPRWECPNCGVMNFARTHNYGNGLVMTPRVYCCHNSRCSGRRFYWRNEKNELFARIVGNEDVEELAWTSIYDPVKFYEEIIKRNSVACC